MMKINVFLSLLVFLMSSLANADEKVTAVAFLHGKGTPYPPITREAWDYWGNDMIKAATKGYSVPYLVVSYDSSHSIKEAADSVAKQLYDFVKRYNINDLVLHAHSYGGVIARYVFSNTDINPKFSYLAKKTRWVNSIASPHLGSPVANLADRLYKNFATRWMIYLIGHNTNSTWNLTTDSMAYFNQHFMLGTKGRPKLPVPFYTIAGKGVWNDWYYFHGEDYRLASLSLLVSFSGEHDAVVSANSAHSVGTKWFTTDANHYHNRRNDYVSMGRTLGKDL